MKKEIRDRIHELGGKSNFTGESLQKDMESIQFNKTFLISGFEDFLQTETYKKIKEIGSIPDSEIVYPRITFQSKIFTPFTVGTEDYEEWNDCLEEATVRAVINEKVLDFMYIGETNSWPNYYFVCLLDKNPKNPTVYSTDHEVFFDEITIEGTLEDYFKKFVDEVEYFSTMESLVVSLHNN